MSFPILMALLLILVVSFALGLAANSELGGRLGRWVERQTLERIPLYSTLKGLAAGFAEIGGGTDSSQRCWRPQTGSGSLPNGFHPGPVRGGPQGAG